MTVPTAEPYSEGYRKLSKAFAGAAMRDRYWMFRALCRGMGSLYFAERPSGQRYGMVLSHSERMAKALCVRCPVRRQCLEYGLEEDYGIWGGTLASERKDRTDIDTMLDEMTEQAVELGLIEKEGAA